MATIKSYTDLPQSKKLAEFLPLENADMIWANDNDVIVVPYDMATRENVLHDFIPCWSLAALLGVLPYYPTLHRTINGWRCDIYNEKGYISQFGYDSDNPVDACVAMIEKLNEQNLI